MRFYQHDVPMGIVRFEDMPLIRSQNRIASESTGLSCWSGTARLGSLEMSKEALGLPWLMGLVYENGAPATLCGIALDAQQYRSTGRDFSRFSRIGSYRWGPTRANGMALHEACVEAHGAEACEEGVGLLCFGEPPHEPSVQGSGRRAAVLWDVDRRAPDASVGE